MNKKTVISVIVLIVVVALLGVAYFLFRPGGTLGPKAFTLEIVHKDGQVKTLEVTASEEFLGEYLTKEGIIEGAEGPYGMYIAKVEGEKAVYEEDNAYWAFYINGEYAQTGVDATELVDGATYAFVKTVSYTEKGEGATSFYFTVKNTDGTVTKFIIHTDKTTVGAALLELGLIAGDESDWGLMVTTVNGITADWDTEQAYWAFYINGEYAQTGVDSTDVVADAVYEMVKTVSAE